MHTRSRGRLECQCSSVSRPSKLPGAGETGAEVGQRETRPDRFSRTEADNRAGEMNITIHTIQTLLFVMLPPMIWTFAGTNGASTSN